MCLGIPGEVVAITDAELGLATVKVGGVRRNISIGLLDGIVPGDWVLVHVGFAMSRIDEGEAQATLAMLEGLGQAYADELTALRSSQIG